MPLRYDLYMVLSWRFNFFLRERWWQTILNRHVPSDPRLEEMEIGEIKLV